MNPRPVETTNCRKLSPKSRLLLGVGGRGGGFIGKKDFANIDVWINCTEEHPLVSVYRYAGT